jgi:hypothetical protein
VHQEAVKVWDACNPDRPDPAIFRTEILPGLPALPIDALVAATGLSEHYCSLIRLGKRVPHARHCGPSLTHRSHRNAWGVPPRALVEHALHLIGATQPFLLCDIGKRHARERTPRLPHLPKRPVVIEVRICL